MNKKMVIISIVVSVLLIITIVTTSYAYFSVSDKVGNYTNITSGTMAIEYNDGNQITASGLMPGDYVEKEFSIRNTGTIATSYDIYLSEVINEFVDQTDLVYEITSNDGGYNTTSQVQVPATAAKIINNYSIGVNETHHYKLKIKFLNKDENQDDNQGAFFSAKIGVNEYKSSGYTASDVKMDNDESLQDMLDDLNDLIG